MLAAALVVGGAVGRAAAAEPVPALQPVVGTTESVFVDEDETLIAIAHRHRVGFEALTRLNPGVDPWLPPPGTVILLPTRAILPPAEREGLVINLPEMRLYDFTVDPVEVLAVAVGDAEDPSPVGEFTIGAKQADPTWHVPESIRAEKPHLPATLPPGEDNPLGGRWMTIGRTSYGIHGTNMRWSIGRRATHGCIRLYEDQIERLYERIPRGTRVQLVYAPYKWGVEGDRILLEAHPDIYDRSPVRLGPALVIPRALGLLDHVDLEAVIRVLDEQRGYPVRVGRLPEEPTPGASAPTSKPTS